MAPIGATRAGSAAGEEIKGWCTVARMGIAARAVGPTKRVERSAARLSSERMHMGIEDGRDPHKIERPHGRAGLVPGYQVGPGLD